MPELKRTCCMPIERVDRPGESQEATGGKKPIDTIVNGNSHTIRSDNEYDTPDKRIHRTLPNIYNDWQRHKIYTILPDMFIVI